MGAAAPPDARPENGPPRRSFLAALAAGAAAALGAVLSAPVLAAVLDPFRRRATRSAGFVAVGRVESFPVGQAVRAEIRGEVVDAWTRTPDVKLGAAWITRREDGSVQALSTVCPHLGCAIDHTAGGFSCPCHGSTFDERGRAVAGPSPRAMDVLETKVEDGMVLVKHARFRQGTKHKAPA